MARIRTIKPTFFTSEDVAELSLRARLTWVGLWTYVDDAGRGKDNVRLIKAALWPLEHDVSFEDVEADLAELADRGRIVRYEVDGKAFLEVAAWAEHQKINRPTPSKIPPPDVSVSPHVRLSESAVSAHVGKGREGKGRGEPPLRCAQHAGSTESPPCGACADARRAHDAWLRAEKSKPTTTGLPPDSRAARCALPGHETETASSCRICAADRKATA